tara:strand:- start:3368 stop:4303 length:936 start_codon:yes stop_codon:yes gene_type:complete
MKLNDYLNPKNSLVLFELGKKLDFFINLYNLNKFPKVLMLTGQKGVGKSTLMNHFMTYVYDRNMYDLKEKKINNNSNFYKQYINNIFPNIIYLSGDFYKNIKVDEMRNLKSLLTKTSISGEERFILFDDVELFSANSLNSLLKIIEEPSKKDFFVLINNKTKPLLETIYSRSLEVKILLKNEIRIKIINNLIDVNDLQVSIDFKNINLTPGNFLLFNSLSQELKLNYDQEFTYNLNLILKNYKKEKNKDMINLTFFLIDHYFSKPKIKNKLNSQKLFEQKSYLNGQIDKFVKYNLNQTSLINAINNKLLNG